MKSWTAERNFPTKIPNGDTSVREHMTGIALRPKDRIRIVGIPDQGDDASLDYIELEPQKPK